jgi:glucokinase
MQEVVAGIDIGGTTVHIGLVTSDGKVFSHACLNTKDYFQPENLAEAVSEKIKAALYDLGPHYVLKGVGVGAPNGNFYKGTIEYAPNLKWFGIIPLAKMIEEQMGVPCLLTNDANAAALGEMIFGAAKGLKDFIFITLGTGLGSGIVTNGQLVYGHDGFAGEMGHVTVVPKGRLCGCGRTGCLETYCSAPGLVKTYQEIHFRHNPTLKHMPGDTDIDAKAVFEMAQSGEKEALEAFSFTSEILGQALANAVAYTSPQAIFLFGGLAAAGNLLFNDVQNHMEENLLNIYKGKVRILPSGLPENDAALLGAASLIWNQK